VAHDRRHDRRDHRRAAGSAAGLLAAVSSDHSLAAALGAGAAIFVAVLWALMRYQHAAWAQAGTALSNIDDNNVSWSAQ
jgi:hypothetical protein